MYRPYARDDIETYEGVKAFLAFEDEQKENTPDFVEATALAKLLTAHHVPIDHVECLPIRQASR